MLSPSQSFSGERLLLDQVIAEFLRAEAAGRAGNHHQWLERYPQCAEGLREFFADRERVDRLMMPLRLDPAAPEPDRRRTDIFLTDPDATIEKANADLVPQRKWGARYRPLNFHAHGGMGEIWLAEDERIGRRVAIKTIRQGYFVEPARFLVEAQVTGQLEHPSVVPLHDMGIDEAGQPYYVMKFVHGRRFRQAISDYHANKSSADWPNDVEFRRLLETFVDICNVVAYAHHKGVLHRDIKPDNVMLGPYGETVVLDWGLAKVMGRPDEVRGSFVRLSGGDSTATQDGAVVGSPYYMSPEGAEGHPEAVDQSSDIYLLGATLYEILTATPPRQGCSSKELIDLARNSRPMNPRKRDRRIPRALEAICLKAMAFQKQDRYETPLAVAADIERYLAGAPVLAYREPLLARFARWVRCHRRGVWRGFTGLMLLAAAGFALHSHRQAQQLEFREQAREQLSEFHRLADEAQFFAANTDAISERVPYYDPSRARVVGEAALAIASNWGQQAERMPISEARAELLQSEYALLLLMAQSALQGGEKSPDAHLALALLDRAQAIHPPSRGYYQLRSRCWKFVGERQAADQDRVRADQDDTPVTAQDHFLQAEHLRLQDVGAAARMLGKQAEPQREHLVNAIDEYRNALRLDPRHYWARLQLGRCLLAQGHAPEAIEALSACIAIRPDSPWAFTVRGLAKALAGHPGAVDDLDQAMLRDPNFQPARLNRGVVHWITNDGQSAIADFDAVLAAAADKRLIEAAFYRGQLLSSQQRDTDALADFSMVINSRPDFRPAYWLRAKTQFQLGKFDEGLSDMKKFVALEPRQSSVEKPVNDGLTFGKSLRKMAQELNGPARTQLLLAAAEQLQATIDAGKPTVGMFEHVGAVHELLGDGRRAIVAYSQGLKLSDDDVTVRNMRAWAYANNKQYEEARADFAESLRRKPDNPEAHAGLGFALAQLGSDMEARKEASAAWLAGADSHLVLHNVACVYGRLSATEPEKKIEHENLALAALQRAITISRQSPLGPDSDEQKLIREETSFPASLRDRPEFHRLLAEKAY